MIHYEAIQPDGTRIPLPAPFSVRLDFEENTPADAFYGMFPLSVWQGPLTRLLVWKEDAVWLDGLVDEEIRQRNEAGGTLELSVRSRTALLLDNEAAAQTVSRPSLPLLAQEHAAPYGFAAVGDPRAFHEPYAVEAGLSEWQALEDFCARYLKAGLYARGDTLIAGPRVPQHEAAFGRGGTAFCAARITNAYCKLLSPLFVRAPYYSNYGRCLKNERAQALGIRRRRFVQEKEGGSSAAQRLAAAQDASFLLRLVHPGPPAVCLGDEASFYDKALGRYTGLRVTKVEYRLDRSGERTTLHLRKACAEKPIV